jgi:RNA polymerase sigma-70 factor (ECF subfamily)
MTDHRAEFSQVVEPLLDGLYASALRLTGSASDAADLVQDTLLRAYQGWDRFEPGTHIRGWLHRIQYNLFVSGYRRRKREQRALDVTSDPRKAERFVGGFDADGPREAPEARLSSAVQAALDALAPEFRAVVVLSDIGELSYRQIADALECPIGTVMSRLHRARRALAQRLSPAEPAPSAARPPARTG